MIRVADYIPKFLNDIGVKHVFLLTGGGIMHLTDGLACNKDIETICCHHEQSSSMALEAYAKLTGHFGVGYFTTGPGATNAITGLAGAWLDSVPCLFISGQVKRKEATYNLKIPGLRQVGAQEINILPIVESLTKYSAMVNNPEDIRYHLEKAYYMSKEGRPGPSWLDIPLDVQGALIDEDKLEGFTHNSCIKKPSDSVITMLCDYISESKRPVVIAGQGVRLSKGINELLALVEKYKIPVVTTYLGIDVIEQEHPEYVGRVGIKADRAGNLAVQNSDLLIVIGSSLPVAEIGYEYSQFAREAKKVVVDIDLSSHKKNTIKIDLLIESDALEFLKKLSASIRTFGVNFDSKWLETCISWKKKYPVCLPEYADIKDKINIYYLIDKLCDKLNGDDIVVTDAGSSFYAGSQAVKIKKGMRYITSGGFGTMGYNLPASIGACIANNKKRVICITGDGSFQQNIQELRTIVHYGLPIKIFIFNNNGYLSIRYTQEKYFNSRFIGESCISGVSFPDTKKIANAYGIKFMKVSHNNMLDKTLDKVLNYDGAVICEVMTPPNQLIIPTVASEKRPDGSMVSRPLEDLYPFLSREEFKKEMIIKLLE